jgi:YHS domain-containing protein/thioredoxin-like negative regulator of GroEL
MLERSRTFWFTVAVCAATGFSGCASAPRYLLSQRSGHAPRSVSAPTTGPSIMTGQYYQARQLEQAGQLPEARQQYLALYTQQPKSSIYVHRLAVVCTKQGDFKAAESYFQKGLKLAPRDANLWVDAGYASYLQKDYSTAEDRLRTALGLSPTHARATNNLALVMGMTGRTDEALALFQSVNPAAQAHVKLAFVLQERGELDAARRQCELAKEIDASVSIPVALQTPTIATEISAEELADLEETQPDETQPVATEDELLEVAANDRLSNGSVQHAEANPEDDAAPQLPASGLTVADEIDVAANEPTNDVASHVAESDIEAEQPAELLNESAADWDADLTSDVAAEFAPAEVAVEQPADSGDVAQELAAAPAADTETEAAAPEFESPFVALEDSFESPVVVEAAPAESSATPAEAAELAMVDPAATMQDGVIELTAEWLAEQRARLEKRVGESGLKGFCPVALRDRMELVDGRAEFAAEYQGQAYQFHSSDAARLFLANPARYMPAAGGLDVVAVKQAQSAVVGSLDHAAWFRGSLFLFTSYENLHEFRQYAKAYMPQE